MMEESVCSDPYARDAEVDAGTEYIHCNLQFI